jgi:hypothetical protein
MLSMVPMDEVKAMRQCVCVYGCCVGVQKNGSWNKINGVTTMVGGGPELEYHYHFVHGCRSVFDDYNYHDREDPCST